MEQTCDKLSAAKHMFVERSWFPCTTLLGETKVCYVFVSDIFVNVKEVLSSCAFSPKEVRLSPQWFNAYGPGQNQEVHDHCPSDLAVIYYLQFDPENHIGTSFWNSDRKIKKFILRDMASLDLLHDDDC